MGSNELEKSPDFLRLLYAITKNCVHNCEDHSLLDFKSAVQYITLHSFLTGSLEPTTFNVSGFIAQLVRASHKFREVTGSNTINKIAFITAKIIAYLISNPQFNILNISYITS